MAARIAIIAVLATLGACTSSTSFNTASQGAPTGDTSSVARSDLGATNVGFARYGQ